MDKFSKAFLVLIDRVIIGLIIGCIALILAGEIQTKLLAISFENARNTALLIGILTAIIGQFLFFRIVPESFRKKSWALIKDAYVMVLIGIYYLFILIIPYIIIFQIARWITTSAVEFLNINQNYSRIIQSMPALITSIFVISGLSDFFFGRKAVASKDFHPIDFETVDQKLSHYEKWQELKEKMQPNDEIWRWNSPAWTWKMMVGRDGYMIVRSGRTTRHSITTGMN